MDITRTPAGIVPGSSSGIPPHAVAVALALLLKEEAPGVAAGRLSVCHGLMSGTERWGAVRILPVAQAPRHTQQHLQAVDRVESSIDRPP